MRYCSGLKASGLTRRHLMFACQRTAMNHWTPPTDPLRQEIAMTAARLIAEFGYDYATAKQKAVKSLLGTRRVDRDLLPSNAEIEDEVREYQALFQADTQPQRLAHLRSVCAAFMGEITVFQPLVYGAVVNGTAGEHSGIHLLAFADDPKETDYFLLNAGLNFEPVQVGAVNGQEVDAVQFAWRGEDFSLATLLPVRRRGLLRPDADGKLLRLDRAGLQNLIDESEDD